MGRARSNCATATAGPTVPVDVEVLDAEPQDSFDDWDQVNECSIDVKSGRIVIAGCTDYFPDAARIQVAPGMYRARISATISAICAGGCPS